MCLKVWSSDHLSENLLEHLFEKQVLEADSELLNLNFGK